MHDNLVKMLRHICRYIASQSIRHTEISLLRPSKTVHIASDLLVRQLYSASVLCKENVVHADHKLINSVIGREIMEISTDSPQQNGPENERWLEIGDPIAEEVDEFGGISLKRGETGVFDVEDLVEILRMQKLQHVAVVSLPEELQYVNYMVICTGRSAKQMTAVAEFIRLVFKKRCNVKEKIPAVEGKDNKDWIALDLGNIALHIFSAKYRKAYDLETLWTCGAKYDELSNQDDNQLASLMESNLFTSST